MPSLLVEDSDRDFGSSNAISDWINRGLELLFSSSIGELSPKQLGVPTKDEGEGEGVAGSSGIMEG